MNASFAAASKIHMPPSISLHRKFENYCNRFVAMRATFPPVKFEWCAERLGETLLP
jgi:hypothetical protein